MSRLCLAWELGEASGYAALMARIAVTARAARHDCVAVVRDLHVAAPMFDAQQLDTPLLQSPLATPTRAPRVRVQTSYATLLHNCGFGDATALVARLRAWLTLYRSFDIERVLVRHSPTALLAARIAGLPVVHYGNGFSMPPATTPLPCFRPDAVVANDILLRNERSVTHVINTALQALGAAPLARLADLLAPLPVYLTSCAELDHYARTVPIDVLGLPDLSYGEAPAWPASRDPRIFASLLPAPGVAAWLRLLAERPFCTLLRLAGSATVTQVPAKLHIARGPLHFGQAIDDAAAVFGYASHNLVYESLIRGRPLALLAYAPDQLMLAQRVESLGLGILLPEQPDAQAEARLQRLIDDPGYAQRAAAFAKRHAGIPREQAPERLLDAALAALPAPLG
jgi:UDP:flavonoid glycosyltransferase YjiC (YdhE family)